MSHPLHHPPPPPPPPPPPLQRCSNKASACVEAMPAATRRQPHAREGGAGRVNAAHTNSCPDPPHPRPLHHRSSTPSLTPLLCSNGSAVAMAEKQVPLDHTTLFHKAAAVITYTLFTLAAFAGVTLSIWLAPASANLLIAKTSTRTVLTNCKILRLIGAAEVLASAWTGLIAGCLHTLTGPDHLAALAPLSIGRTKVESLAVGALWGCGHDAGQVLFGIIFLLLKDRLHIEVIRTWGTRVVGLTLVAIGVLGIKEAREAAIPCLAGNETNVLQKTHSNRSKFGFTTFATGIVHGLQPDALLMLLPALTLPSRLAGGAFLCMFLFGTVLAMGSYTAFIGSCSHALRKKGPRITEQLSLYSSVVAILTGSAILVNAQFGWSLV